MKRSRASMQQDEGDGSDSNWFELKKSETIELNPFTPSVKKDHLLKAIIGIALLQFRILLACKQGDFLANPIQKTVR